MSQISKESIEKVLAATDIVDLIGAYVPLKRAGPQFKANCPFHHEKTPSFSVNPARQTFKCFGCGKGGDAVSFVMEYENLPFVEAVRKLASRANIPLEAEVFDPLADQSRKQRGRLLDLHREAAAFLHERLLDDSAAQHARDYLKGRGFGREMAASWTVGWMPDHPQAFLDWARAKKFSGRDLVDSGLAALRNADHASSGLFVRFRDRLMFPIRNELGDVIAFSGRQLRADPNSGKYINSPETMIFRKSNVLFALDRAKKPILREKAALLCEGQIDVIACHELGIEHAIAPLGTAFTQQHAHLLRRYTGSVLLCYDADRAGIAASERAFRELVAEGLSVRVVEMPDGDDPDTYLKAHGVAAFRELLGRAREFFDFKLGRAKANGAFESAAERRTIAGECVGLLAAMSDAVARDHQINVVATHLQTSGAALRGALAKALQKPSREPAAARQAESDNAPAVEPTPVHRIVAFLCHLALSSAPAQHFLAGQFETLHEANRWLDGIPLLERILSAAPDPASHAAVNVFIGGLPEADRLALGGEGVMLGGLPMEGIQAAEHALAMLSATVLQRRDARVKADLKQPGLNRERLVGLLEEAKEISALLRGIGQRSEFDDELPAATYKPKPPPGRKWEERKK
ncbi:MAG: DNA primase [Verrucomicrobia bacterium]|nr:DNA primase [Verrucomicrobiota bacterium]